VNRIMRLALGLCIVGVLGQGCLLTRLQPRKSTPALSLALCAAVEGTSDVVVGKVLDGDGNPVAGVRVAVVQEEPICLFRGGNQPHTLDSLYSTTTRGDGSFALDLWEITRTANPDRVWLVLARDDARGLMGAAAIRAVPAEPLEIRLSAAAYVHTRILDAEGQPMHDVGTSLTLAHTGVALQGQSSDERGDLQIGPLPAGVPLRLYPTWIHLYLALTDKWLDQTRAELTLGAGETREFPPLRVGVKMRMVKGTVVLGDGRPVAGAKVQTIVPSIFPVSTETDDKGRFGLIGLLPTRERLWVLASHPTEPLHVVQTLDPATDECRLRLRPLTSAEGQLADAQGQPVVGAEVEPDRSLRIGEGRGEEYWQADGLPLPGRQVVRTDTDGYFSLCGLVSGAPYVAWVRASDVHYGYWRMAFIANADKPVDLGLLMSRN